MADVDIAKKLEEQLQSLEAACREYDLGRRDEALRIALPLRVIFHDKNHSVSLLTQLGARFVNLLSTCTKNPQDNPGGYWPGLIQWDLDAQNSIFVSRPKIDTTKSSHRLVAFDYWWNSEPVYQFNHRKVHRRDLVLAAASTDGTGRVDFQLPPAYQWVVDGSGWKATLRSTSGPERDVVVHFAHFASLRQIAYEVLNSKELLKLAAR